MLLLPSSLRDPDGLTFSPDGAALLAVAGNTVQVWSRWLDAPPAAARVVQGSLVRYAFSSDGARVYLYVSGKSHTRVLDVATGAESDTVLPYPGPTWFHFTTGGGYMITGHGRGTLTRYDEAPGSKDGVRKVWSIERPCPNDADPTAALGSHYRFGAICGPAGSFVGLEYRYNGGEPLDGMAVRSVADGALIRRIKVTAAVGKALLAEAGLRLSIHPSGAYFAHPQKRRARLWPLVPRTDVLELPALQGKCRAVAFHPSGAYLAAVAGDAVTLYDTATWQVVRTLEWQIGELRAVCFTPDGTRGAAIGTGEPPGRGKKAPGGKIVVWDVDV